MVIERAYGRIFWRKKDNMPEFQMINHNSQKFTIYAEPLINIYRNLEHYVTVKRRNREPDDKSDKYQSRYKGEIQGIAEEIKNKGKTYFLLKLFFAKAYKKMDFDKETGELLDFVEAQEYYFPKLEFIRFAECIDSMHTQRSDFTKLKMNMDVHIFRKKTIVKIT